MRNIQAKIDKDSLKRYLIRGSAWAFFGKVCAALMGLALAALLTRLLSPAEMGVYFLAFNLATFCAILARMGMENTLLRYVSEALGNDQPGRARAVVSKGLVLAAVSALLVAAIVGLGGGAWIAGYFFNSALLERVAGFIALWLVLLAFQFLFAEIFRAIQDIRAAVLFGGLLTSLGTAFFLACLLVVKGNATLREILLWVLIAGVLNSVCAAWVLRGKVRNFPTRTRQQGPPYRELVSHSWPLLVNALTLFVLTRSDLWILGVFRSDEDVAVYGAAARLVLLTGMALVVVNAVVPPLIGRLHVQKDCRRLEHILRTAASFAAVPSLSVLAVFIIFGPWVLEIVFGTYYRTGGTVLVVLSIAQAVNVYVGSCGYTLIMTGHRRTMMMISVISAALAVGCGLILAKPYGKNGVAMGYAFAATVQQFAMLLFARRRCGIWTHAGFRFVADPVLKRIREKE